MKPEDHHHPRNHNHHFKETFANLGMFICSLKNDYYFILLFNLYENYKKCIERIRWSLQCKIIELNIKKYF